MIEIDGDTFDVPVVSIEETINFLDKFAERTANGKLRRELIGVYRNYQIRFGTVGVDQAELKRLWDKLKEPEEFHEVKVPDYDGVDFEFTAYFTGVARSLKKWKPSDKTLWKNLVAEYIAKDPAATP